jgi:hypothetical protein
MRQQPGILLVGLYAWIVAMAFGASLLDVVYAAHVPGDSTVDLGEVSDLLLGITALTVLAAIGAITASWGWKTARYLLVASLVVVVAELLTPAVLSQLVRDAEGGLRISIGPWVRLGESLLASVLAFVGLWQSWRRGCVPAPA